MRESGSRQLYRRILLLYPKPFRDEFGDEMLSMFAECIAVQGPWRVFADLLLSAAKQRVHYFSIPAPKSAPLYAEIAWSPNLARILALAVVGVVLIASALTEREQPVARESWTRPCGGGRIFANQVIAHIVHSDPVAEPHRD